MSHVLAKVGASAILNEDYDLGKATASRKLACGCPDALLQPRQLGRRAHRRVNHQEFRPDCAPNALPKRECADKCWRSHHVCGLESQLALLHILSMVMVTKSPSRSPRTLAPKSVVVYRGIRISPNPAKRSAISKIISKELQKQIPGQRRVPASG